MSRLGDYFWLCVYSMYEVWLEWEWFFSSVEGLGKPVTLFEWAVLMGHKFYEYSSYFESRVLSSSRPVTIPRPQSTLPLTHSYQRRRQIHDLNPECFLLLDRLPYQGPNLTYHLLIAARFLSFYQSISAKWNINNPIQNLNSVPSVHFLRW